MRKWYLFLTGLIITNTLLAQWNSSAAGGTLVVNAVTAENYQVAVTDGANGSIIIFQSDNGTVVSNLYAQRINSNGQVQWGAANNPKPVCIHSSEKYIDNIMPDGSGGVYIAWYDYRRGALTSDLYIQHINSNGDPLWTVNGIKVNSNTDRDAGEVRMCSDGGTGVIVTWGESVYDDNLLLTTYSQLFVQKFSSAGVAQWTADGVEVSTVSSLRAGASVVPDGSGGVIVAFADARNSNQAENDIFDNIDIYAQRINSSGALLWTNDGKAVCTTPYNQMIAGEYLQSKASVTDGAAGMVILFDDYTGNNDGNSKYYAQRLNASGAIQWAAAGVPVCASGGAKSLMNSVSDGAGGMVSFWSEDRNSNSVYNLYAQRILTNGTPNWAADGIKLVDLLGGYIGYGNGMTEDGTGNYIVAWTDNNNVLKAQKINNSGAIQWGVTNKDICNNSGAFPTLPSLVKSDAGATIISWLDNRDFNTSSTNIYAAKLDNLGYLVSSNAYITVANGNWNVGATWLGGIVPPANADVRVRHTVVITANASCNSLRVELPAGNLTVNAGMKLTVQQ